MADLQEIERFPLTGRFLLGRARHAMSEDEKQEFEGIIDEVRDLAAGERLVHRGRACDHSTMLIEGFMVRTLEADGRRYAVSFHVPGDFVDLHCYALKRLDHNIDCVGPAKVGMIPHGRIDETMNKRPHLARLFWFSTLLDAAMHREWIMKLEQLTAPRRIAHILAEIWRRLDMVGLGREDGFETPLTQSELAEMCGATAIHVNRALGELRREGIVQFERGSVTVPDRKRLETFGDFNPDYLYGDGQLGLAERDL